MKQVHIIVLDAGPILTNEPPLSTLLGQAEVLYTVPSVVGEIRDPVARSRFETTLLPFLKIRTPRTDSIKTISEFSRKTGDFEVLSKTDIRILALAYELECERNQGDWRLRSLPGQKRVNGAPPPYGLSDVLEGNKTSLSKNTLDSPIVTAGEVSPDETTSVPETQRACGINASTLVVESDSFVVTTEATIESEEINDQSASSRSLVLESVATSDYQTDMMEFTESSTSEESESEGWITPANIKKHRAKNLQDFVEPQAEAKIMQVATITSDFAMQNVLLRMNLNILSTSLQRIRLLKSWVLRCHACFNITKDMSKQFCNRCGKPTLLRTSCSTDKDGNFKVHLKKNMQWNTRGNIYSIPKPIPGSANGKVIGGGGKGGWGQELILAEDQKEYVQAMTDMRRKKDRDLMNEDYMPSILSGERGRAGGKPKVGAGRNVNSKKRNK